MKTRSLITLLAAPLFLALSACQPSYKSFPQLDVLDPLLSTQLTFQAPLVQRLPGDLVKIDVAVTNTSAVSVTLNYRYMFTINGNIVDASQFQLQPLVLGPGLSAMLTGTSDKPIPPAPQGDFKMEIKRQ